MALKYDYFEAVTLIQKRNVMDIVLSLSIEEASDYLEYLFKENDEELLWQRWIACYQDTMSFSEFKLRLYPAPEKSEEEIIDEAQNIIENFYKEVNAGGNI